MCLCEYVIVSVYVNASMVDNLQYVLITAIQFVLSDEFSHLRPEQRLALLHVSKTLTGRPS